MSIFMEKVTYFVPLKRDRRWWERGAEEEKREKRILHEISGAIKPGSLTAIMGPSGAGKSHLSSLSLSLSLSVCLSLSLCLSLHISRYHSIFLFDSSFSHECGR